MLWPRFRHPNRLQRGERKSNRVRVELEGPLTPRVSGPNPPHEMALEKGTIVIAAGGGGIPTVYEPGRVLRGIEAVIDKDLCSELLARELEADVFTTCNLSDNSR